MTLTDTGPLVALLDRNDPNHLLCVEAAGKLSRGAMLTTWPCFTEAMYLLYRAGAFPAPDRPRTLWLGAGAGAQAMVALHGAIQRKLDRLGYRGEQRRYVPHITLGRAGRNSPPRPLVRELAGLAEFDAGSMLVDEVTVFASKLTPEGPRYEVLARAPLAE